MTFTTFALALCNMNTDTVCRPSGLTVRCRRSSNYVSPVRPCNGRRRIKNTRNNKKNRNPLRVYDTVTTQVTGAYGIGSRRPWQHWGKLRTTHCILRYRLPVIKHFAAELVGTPIHTSRRNPCAITHRYRSSPPLIATPLPPAHQCVPLAPTTSAHHSRRPHCSTLKMASAAVWSSLSPPPLTSHHAASFMLWV